MEYSPRSRAPSSGLLSRWVNTPHDESLLNNEQFIFAPLSQRPRLQRAASLWLQNEDVPGKQGSDKATYFDNIGEYIAGCDNRRHQRENKRSSVPNFSAKANCSSSDLNITVHFVVVMSVLPSYGGQNFLHLTRPSALKPQ